MSTTTNAATKAHAVMMLVRVTDQSTDGGSYVPGDLSSTPTMASPSKLPAKRRPPDGGLICTASPPLPLNPAGDPSSTRREGTFSEGHPASAPRRRRPPALPAATAESGWTKSASSKESRPASTAAETSSSDSWKFVARANLNTSSGDSAANRAMSGSSTSGGSTESAVAILWRKKSSWDSNGVVSICLASFKAITGWYSGSTIACEQLYMPPWHQFSP
mmetsp:Transcript_20149/g.55772  ORF Transcript_20149/g.55772 Transcript_20149/m.55772 type:complete len:219 (-) Transcript_20149:96-752(-)